MFFWIILWTLETIKLCTLFQRGTKNCKEATKLPVQTISGQVAIFILGGAGNGGQISKQQWERLSFDRWQRTFLG